MWHVKVKSMHVYCIHVSRVLTTWKRLVYCLYAHLYILVYGLYMLTFSPAIIHHITSKYTLIPQNFPKHVTYIIPSVCYTYNLAYIEWIKKIRIHSEAIYSKIHKHTFILRESINHSSLPPFFNIFKGLFIDTRVLRISTHI